jgi:hypothetical protein
MRKIAEYLHEFQGICGTMKGTLYWNLSKGKGNDKAIPETGRGG